MEGRRFDGGNRGSGEHQNTDVGGGGGDDVNPSQGDPASSTRNWEDSTSTAADVIQGSYNVEEMLANVQIDTLRSSLKMIESLKQATMNDLHLDPDVQNLLCNPVQESLEILDPDLRFSIENYLALESASEDAYRASMAAVKRRFPDSSPLSYEQVRKKIAELSGVHAVTNHMCPNTCLAYTGPYANDTECEICSTPRYDQEILQRSGGKTLKPNQKFCTIPIGPQIQAAFRHPEGARNMRYRAERTAEILKNGRDEVFNDYIQGSDYLEAVVDGRIGENDVTLMFSIDGAQLYQSKVSDCWIYIWVIMNYAPDIRYKKRYILPGAFIPGPNKPKNLESFLYPGLTHLSVLQKEGLKVWDAEQQTVFVCFPFLLLVTADGPAMAAINGLVGHHGRMGCRLYCGTVGRHKHGGTHYFPALSKPLDYVMNGCDHETIPINKPFLPSERLYRENLTKMLAVSTEREFRARRLQTGIAKPSIFIGLEQNRMLGIVRGTPLDMMHLISLNISDLLLGLIRADIDVDRHDDVNTWDWAIFKKGNPLSEKAWKDHGRMVAEAKPFLPTSFDRPPRDPSLKLNSGYKAWEFLNYMFVIGPGVFIYFMPRKYYEHYCKLVAAIRILQQRILTETQIQDAHVKLLEYVRDFEGLYYQQKESRLHFCRQSIHLLLHIAPETDRLGPLTICTQWPMERTIGNLGQEIRQHSTFYANLSERGVRRCRVNALIKMVPDLEPTKPLYPRGAQDLGEGYALLRAKDTSGYLLNAEEASALQDLLATHEGYTDLDADLTGSKIYRWARFHLPNGQIARSAWKEKTNNNTRSSRNVKVCSNS
jgi:hypothetical protein